MEDKQLDFIERLRKLSDQSVLHHISIITPGNFFNSIKLSLSFI